MATVIQDAIDALPAAGGTIQLAAQQYFESPLDIRDKTGVRIIGEGMGTEIAFLVGADEKTLIDLTNSDHCEISHVRVTERTNIPRVGMLLARDGSASAGWHRFESIRWEAKATLAQLVSLGSEINTYTHCQWLNATAGASNFITERENNFNVESQFGDVNGGSNLSQCFYNCFWGLYADTGFEINLILGSGTEHFYIFGGNISNKTADKTSASDPTAAAFQIGAGDQIYPCEQIVINGVESESYGTNNALQVVGRVRGLRLQNCLLQALEAGIRVTPEGNLQDSIIEQNSLENGMGQYDWYGNPARALMQVNGTMTDCKIDLRGRWIGILSEDKSPGDQGRRPDVALAVSHDAGYSDNEIILRDWRHLVAPGVN